MQQEADHIILSIDYLIFERWTAEWTTSYYQATLDVIQEYQDYDQNSEFSYYDDNCDLDICGNYSNIDQS